jgi:hypothetical protein
MAQNLIGLLEQLLGSNEVLSRLGALIGLSPARTEEAIGAAVPAILAGLVGVAQKPEGRNRLAALVQNQDTGLLDDITGALSGGREKGLIDSGRGMLGSLFGSGNLDGLAGALSRSTGLDRGAAGSLLGALAPVVMGALGREQRSQGLDAQGLARMLADQKDNIAHALPASLASSLGSTGLLEGIGDRLGESASTVAHAGRASAAEATRTAGAAATAPRAAGSAVRAPERGGGSILRWAVGLAAVLALVWAAYHFLYPGEQVREAADPATDAPAEVGEAADNLMVGDVDVGREITGWFENATATLEGITDAGSAEAAVPKLNELNDGLAKLGGLAEQLPAEGKSALAALVSGSLASLESLIAKVSEIPGVGDVIQPVAGSMLEKLRAMTA